MPDGIVLPVLALGFGFVLIAGSWLTNGSTDLMAGLFASQAVRDWPPGVQEPDAPRFDVAHVDAIRSPATPPDDDPIELPEIVEVFDRRL
jgi:hypothetical protein